MALDKCDMYRNIQFSTEACHDDFYMYLNANDLAAECEKSKEEVFKCRTVGILESQHGKFWLADMGASGVRSEVKIRVSLKYLKSSLPSTVVSYPIQVFGTVQWKNNPVIFVNIMQVLNIPMAIRIRNIMNKIAATHQLTKYTRNSCFSEYTNTEFEKECISFI